MGTKQADELVDKSVSPKPYRLKPAEHHLPPEFLPNPAPEPQPEPRSAQEPEPAPPYDAVGPRGGHGDPR